MTIAQKILAAHSGHASVEPGEYVNVKIDLAFTMEGYTPLVVDAFKEMGATRAFDPKKVVFFDDHTTPSKDISSAEQSKIQRDFARQLGAAYLDVGRAGIEHAACDRDPHSRRPQFQLFQQFPRRLRRPGTWSP